MPGSMDFDSARSPNPSMKDSNRDMSTGKSPYQSDRGMAMGDMSFSSDAARFSGGFSRDFTVDSEMRGVQGSGNARTFGGRYAIEDDNNAYRPSDRAANNDEGSHYGSSVTPYRTREDSSMGDRDRDRGSSYSAGPYPASADRIGANMDSGNGMRVGSGYGRTGMMIGTSSEHSGGKAFDHLVSEKKEVAMRELDHHQ